MFVVGRLCLRSWVLILSPVSTFVGESAVQLNQGLYLVAVRVTDRRGRNLFVSTAVSMADAASSNKYLFSK